MQNFNDKQKPRTGFKIDSLPLEDRNRLVGAFVWLITQDKKQNPELYKTKEKQND